MADKPLCNGCRMQTGMPEKIQQLDILSRTGWCAAQRSSGGASKEGDMYTVKIVVVMVFALMGVTHSRAEMMLALCFAVWKQEQRSHWENLGLGVGNWLSGEAGALTFRGRLN